MFRISCFAGAFLCAASLAWAQSPQGNISGTVHDSAEAAVPQAEVSAIHEETGVRTSVRSNTSGFYSLQALPIGLYIVRVEMPGFKADVQSGVSITTGSSLEINFRLQVGQVTESVVVTTAAPVIETRSSEASQLIEAKTIEDVPLGDRRAMNVLELNGAAVFVSYNSGSRPYFSVGGGRGRSQNFVMDGGSGQTIRIGQAQIEVDPPVATLQEVRVLTNGFSAEYGGTAGGVVVMNTKSGTNSFRGELFEFFRNEKLDAGNFFSPWVNGQKQRAPIRYNVYGGTLGGPVLKNKLFFFGAWEGSRRRDGDTVAMTVPTLAERAGDYSQTLNANNSLAVIYDPATTRLVNGVQTRDAFPGNRVPANRIDPVAVNVLKFYPNPSRAPDNAAGTNNFRANTVDILDRDNTVVKVDYSLSDKDKIMGRFLWYKEWQSTRSLFTDPAAEGTGNTRTGGWNLFGSWNRILKANLLNEFRAAFVQRDTNLTSPSYKLGYPTKLGLRNIPDDAFPRFNLTGYTPLGSNNQVRLQSPIQQVQFIETISWIAGRHSVRTGFEARLSRNYDFRQQQVSGAFTFNRALSGRTGVNSTGNTIASLLLGSPATYRAAQPPPVERSSWYAAGFFQDDWQLHPDLVLNIGVRWEMDTPFRTVDNILNGFDGKAINPVSGTPGVVRFAGIDGFPSAPHNMDWNNFGPRVGFAWKPFGSTKTVVRTAFGMFFAAPYDGAGSVTNATLGFGPNLVIPTSDDGSPVAFRLSDPIPVVSVSDKLDATYGAARPGQTPSTSVTFYEKERTSGYSMQMNFRIQRQIGAGTAVEAGYLGNLSRRMPSTNLSINQIRPELLGGAGTTQSRRPFPQFSDVFIESPALGVMNYHAFTAKLEKRFSRGFNILTTYTHSKSLDNTNAIAALGNEGSPYSNFYNRRADYGPGENDIRNRVTWGSVYQIPYGKGRRYGDKSMMASFLGNWSVSSVLVAQSAPPFTVRTATNTSNAFSSGPLRADILRDPNLDASRRSLFRWFDTDAFAQPAANTFGNQGVNQVRGGGRLSLNGSILRDFPVGESRRVQFRAEAFNLLNHSNFNLPGQVLGNPDFGLVSGAQQPRQVQLGLRFIF